MPLTSGTRSKVLFWAAICVSMVLGLTPTRYTGWLGEFSSLTHAVVGPMSQPIGWVGRRLRQAASRDPATVNVELVEEQRDEYQRLYEAERRKVDKLTRQLEEMHAGSYVTIEQPMRQVFATVMGASSNLSDRTITVRAGRRDGVHEKAVAVTAGVQLVGLVSEVDARTSQVRPITDPAQGHIDALLMVKDGVGIGCILKAQGDGTLRGPLAAVPAGVTHPALDDLVRLDDARWPAHSQRMVVGKVSAIEQSPDSPLRLIVTVTPTVDVSLVSEVVVRITEQPEDDAGGETR